MSSPSDTPMDVDPPGPERTDRPLRRWATYVGPDRPKARNKIRPAPYRGRPRDEVDNSNAKHLRHSNLDIYEVRLASIHRRLDDISMSMEIDNDLRLKLDEALRRDELDAGTVTKITQQWRETKYLSHIADSLLERWQRTHLLNDLDIATVVCERLEELLSDDDPNKFRNYCARAYIFRMHFEILDSVEAITSAIDLLFSAVNMPFFEHLPNDAKSGAFVQLGDCFRHYAEARDPSYLADAESAYRHSLDFMDYRDPVQRRTLNKIGLLLQEYARYTGELKDVDQAILAHENAIDLTPSDEIPELPEYVCNLGTAYLLRFKWHGGEREYLERAIRAHCRAITLLPAGHDSERGILHFFSESFRNRRGWVGESVGARNAVEIYERAVSYARSSHLPDWPRIQAEYGKALVNRFIHRGQPLDIERAIEVYENIFETSPSSLRSDMLMNEMGVALHLRFETSEEWDDLMSALKLHERAVELVSQRSPEKSRLFDNLAMTWQTRYILVPEMEYINAALFAHARAVEYASSDEHPQKPLFICHRGTSHRIRYDQSEDLRDLESAVEMHKTAWSLLPQDDPLYPELLNELGLSLLERFKNVAGANRNNNDLLESVSAHRRAVQLAKDDHPKRLTLRRNLGEVLRIQFEDSARDQNTQILEEAMECFMEVGPIVPGFGVEQLKSAAACARMLTKHRDFTTQHNVMLAWTGFMDAFETEAAWLGYSVRRRFRTLSMWGGDVSNAVAAALHAEKNVQAAEWLEAGRSMIWTQVLSLRDPIGVEIWERDPGLAATLRDYTQTLQEGVYAPLSAAMPERSFEDFKVQDIPSILRNPKSLHRRRVLDYEAVLEGIREHEEFEDFRRRKSVLDLLRSPHVKEHLGGYIVFLNVHETRSDAIVIVPGDSINIESTQLPELSYKRAQSLGNGWSKVLWDCEAIRDRGAVQRATVPPALHNRNQIIFHNALKSLWDWVVYPILQLIEREGLRRKETPGRLPHITWCPSGALTELPFHAAGDYKNPAGPRAYNHFVSSYAPSLSALVRSSEQALQKRTPTRALIVTQPATPNHSALPNTERERGLLQSILSQVHISNDALAHTDATVAAVGSAIDGYSWLHLACHGKQDWSDPTKSAFALYDGPLSIPDLMRTAGNSAELAFLSACQTAKGDEQIKEEAAHLAAGMLAVGFCGVVGTMWSIGDADAPVVVEAFYTKLIEMRNRSEVGPGETGAAYALHEAVARLRERVGVNNFVKWAPFVHYGV